ncbi:MAG: class II aldolase/adducin family protein [Brevinema sp.]
MYKIRVEYCEQIIKTALEMIAKGYTNGTAGNISIYDREEELIYLTPASTPYDEIKNEDISVFIAENNTLGKQIQGKKSTSELSMHTFIYFARKDISAVIHGHTKYCTTLAVAQKELPACEYMIASSGENIVRCTKYIPYGTDELANEVVQTLGEKSRAVLLANHGVTVCGSNLKLTFNILEQIEYVAMLYLQAKSAGLEPVILTDEEMSIVHQKFSNYFG